MMNTILPSLADIQEARQRIAGAAIRTPLIRLNLRESPAEIYLKLTVCANLVQPDARATALAY
jgi:threonine dehydratase